MNDEVNVPCLSPSLYREFVLPLEKELADFHGGIRYWHSCGNLVPLLPLIRELKPEVQHISPFNDFATAVDRAGDAVMQVWMHPAEDVVLADEETMARALRAKVEVCEAKRVRGYTVTTGHMQTMRSPDHTIEQAKAWVRAARRVAEEVGRTFS
jgi:uroporphyrinogen-III decarboxylase